METRRPYGGSMDLLPLEGFVVGVTADRRQQEQTTLLERRGAQVMVGPSIRTSPLGPEDGARAATDDLLDRPPDLVIANTGIGVRGWLAYAESWGREEDVFAVLRRARIAARGPKAVGALTTAGLSVWYQEPSETMAGLVHHVIEAGVTGTRIALIHDGGNATADADRLEAAGATVVTVPVYRWTIPEDERPAWRLVEAVCERRVDAVTFTAAPALRNLFTIAAQHGVDDVLRKAFNGAVVAACQGPVCADAATDAGIRHPLVPDRARLGALVQRVTAELSASRRVLSIGGLPVAVQGRALVIGDERVWLSDREHAVFHALVQKPGAVVPRALLLRIWGSNDSDGHVVDATIARLRQRLGPAAEAVVSVPRRGYRLDAEESRAS
jgi:uroporphyrinogen-III synthase